MMNYIQELALAQLYNEATVTFSRSESMNEPLVMWKYVGLAIPIAAAIRLAKFNNDPRQSKHFFGVPTPMSALFIASIASMIFVFSIDPNDTKHLKEVSKIESISQNDRIFMKVADLGEDNPSNFWKAEVKELSDTGILLQQGLKKYRLPVAEMNTMIDKGQVFIKSSGLFNSYFYTLTGMILLSVILSILMISELGVLAVKKLPSAIWKNVFLGGWLVILVGGVLLHWRFVPNFSHPEGTSWLIKTGLNKPMVAILSALPFALVFHLIFSLIYFTFKAQENEV
jgi:phosphatidylserine synthase